MVKLLLIIKGMTLALVGNKCDCSESERKVPK